ncbi:MAG TPA: oxygenase MpaB family protein [Allosphingosinicella sp.]
MHPLRRVIRGEVQRLFASPGAQGEARASASATAARSKPGYFAPDAVARRVHGDLTTMLAGGISALLLQMLHPGALAGVWDHSDFQRDMSGRLRRTAQFISATTYGSRKEADALIARVQAIHDGVHGTLPDGTPYSANDPDLLTWVHIAGSWSFLHSWLTYGEPLARAECDRYYAETAVVAEKLGAREVPKSVAEVEAYLERMRPLLRADGRTRTVARALLGAPAPSFALEPVRKLLMRAGSALLPPFAAQMHDLPTSGKAALVPAVKTLRRVTRWGLNSRA